MVTVPWQYLQGGVQLAVQVPEDSSLPSMQELQVVTVEEHSKQGEVQAVPQEAPLFK